jgi:parallel beta-helix repeat protein
LLGASGSSVADNTITDAKEAAILLKNSSGNAFSNNSIEERSIIVRGDSSANSFTGNDVLEGRFTFKALEEDGLWGFPHDNVVTGGSVKKASTCFEFVGAYDNTVDGTVIDSCEPYDLDEAGGQQATGNQVDVIVEPGGPDDGGAGPGAGTGGTSKCTSGPTCRELELGGARLSIAGKGRDRFKLRGNLHLGEDVDTHPGLEGVEIEVTNSHSTIFYAFIDGSDLAWAGGSYRFEDPAAILTGGVAYLRIRPEGAYRYGLRVRGFGDLVAADLPDITVTVTIGDDAFPLSRPWRQASSGWRTP